MTIKKVVGDEGNKGAFKIFKPSWGKLSKKKFNQVYKRRLNVTERESGRVGVQAEFGTQVDVGKGSIGGNLDGMITQCPEQRGKVQVIGFEVVELWDVHQKVSLHVLILWGPDSFAAFVDDGVLVWVVVGNGARRGSKEIGEEVGFWKDGEAKGMARRSGQGWERDNSNGGGDNGQQEVLDGDVSKWDALDYFLETLMDVSVLGLGVGVAKLRTREVVLLSGDVGEYFKEIGRGGDEDG